MHRDDYRRRALAIFETRPQAISRPMTPGIRARARVENSWPLYG